MPKILVTGARFIGARVAEALLAPGHDVTAVDDLSGGATENPPPPAEFVQDSVTDAPFVERPFAGLEHQPARVEAPHAYSSHLNVRRVSGECPETALETGFAAMPRWAGETGSRECRNLPSSGRSA